MFLSLQSKKIFIAHVWVDLTRFGRVSITPSQHSFELPAELQIKSRRRQQLY